MANVACHILQLEIYPSQTVDDNLDTLLANTASSLEEDLNYIRSVLKKLHGGATWYDVGNYSVSDFVNDFKVEHYTSDEDPIRAGQHKDVHADSLNTPFLGFNKPALSSAPIIDFQGGYRLFAEDSGPLGEVGGTRLWFDTPDGATDASGIVFGPRAGAEYARTIRFRTNRAQFESLDDQIPILITSEISSATDLTTVQFLRTVDSDNYGLSIIRTSSGMGILPILAGTGDYTVASLMYFDTDRRWTIRSELPSRIRTATGILDIGSDDATRVAFDTDRTKFWFSKEVEVEQDITAWPNTSATGQFPIKVGSEDYGVWHQGNQGHLSGLDADTVDGSHLADIVGQRGAIKPSSQQYGLYKVGRIFPDTTITATGTEPYFSVKSFLVKYKLPEIDNVYWFKFNVIVRYDTSSGNWVVDSMRANVIDGVFSDAAVNLRLIVPSDILLRKVSVGGVDEVHIYIQTYATYAEIYEIDNNSSELSVINETDVGIVELFTSTTSTPFSEVDFNSWVAGLYKNRLHESLSINTTALNTTGDISYLSGGNGIDNFLLKYGTNTGAYLIDANTGSYSLISVNNSVYIGGTYNGFLAVDRSSSNTTDVTIYEGYISSTLFTTLTSPAPIINPSPFLGYTVGYPIVVNMSRTTVSSSTFYNDMSLLYNNISVKGVDSSSAYQYNITVKKSYSSLTTQTEVFVGGKIYVGTTDVSFYKAYLVNTVTPIYSIVPSSAYVQDSEAIYNIVAEVRTGTLTKSTEIVHSRLDLTLGQIESVAYLASTWFPQATFIVEHVNDGTKAVLAYTTSTSASEMKIAFIDDFRNITGLSGITISSTGTTYIAIGKALLLYPEELEGSPVFLIPAVFRINNRYISALVVINGADWSYYVLEYPDRFITSNEGGGVIKQRARNGIYRIPVYSINRWASFNPALFKLDKFPVASLFGSGFKNTTSDTFTITQGSLAETLSSGSSYVKRYTTTASITSSLDYDISIGAIHSPWNVYRDEFVY